MIESISTISGTEAPRMPPFTDCIWLITGIPGSGKTSVSKALSERLPRSAHIEVDRLREMVVGGYLAPGQKPLAESDAQLELGAQNGALLAHSFMTKGFTSVVDDVILRLQLMQYRKVLSRWPLRLVVLAPAIEVALGAGQAAGGEACRREILLSGQRTTCANARAGALAGYVGDGHR